LDNIPAATCVQFSLPALEKKAIEASQRALMTIGEAVQFFPQEVQRM
jgi:hypothetical protein